MSLNNKNLFHKYNYNFAKILYYIIYNYTHIYLIIEVKLINNKETSLNFAF